MRQNSASLICAGRVEVWGAAAAGNRIPQRRIARVMVARRMRNLRWSVSIERSINSSVEISQDHARPNCQAAPHSQRSLDPLRYFIAVDDRTAGTADGFQMYFRNTYGQGTTTIGIATLRKA